MTSETTDTVEIPLLAAAASHGPLTGEEVFDAFLNYVTESGIELYAAQEEAILEIVDGASVILNTPTGSGKSLVALAMHFLALSQRRRSFYTAPIKALVSEKFFALCSTFGASNVGLMTGDAAINSRAPIICCTAEVLSQMALRQGAGNGLDFVIMDEFHYYSDRERGVAWQVPLLELSDATFLLMSATLGDVTELRADLENRTGRRVALVQSAQRPVPLEFTYKEMLTHEVIDEVVRLNRTPAYLVSSSQREAKDEAQAMLSTTVASRAARDRIASEIRRFRFDSPFGPVFRSYIIAGVGLHHAGLLPKYRLLVERLAQAGLLSVISGTDTLGVGINVPIRTVILTKLCKFDGEKVAILSVRDFKQIAGRAGRKGFDSEGWVIAQAPEHVVENKRAETKATAAGRKAARKAQPPKKGFVHWDENTFVRLVEGQPEQLKSSFRVDHGMLLNVLQREGHGGYRAMMQLIERSHESNGAKSRLRAQCRTLFQALTKAAIVEVVQDEATGRRVVRASPGLQTEFSLHQALSLFIVEAVEKLELSRLPPQDYALAVLSFVEAIQENPTQILLAQVSRLKSEAIASMKAAGVEYEERMAELEKIEYPKPLENEIYDWFNDFSDRNPWVGRENVRPKSIAREMFENYLSFSQFVKQYEIESVEGLLLRYLNGVYKVLVRTIPIAFLNDPLIDAIGFFQAMLERVDSSLLQEWEQMLDAPAVTEEQRPAILDISKDSRAFRARIRAEMHAVVRALALNDWQEASLCVLADPDDPWTPERIEAETAPYFDDYPQIRADHAARLPEYTLVRPDGERKWEVTQILLDPEDNKDWFIRARVELPIGVAIEGPMIRLEFIGK